MLSQNALRRNARVIFTFENNTSIAHRRYLHYDGRNRLSNFWTPTQRQPIEPTTDLPEPEHGHDLLARAGFLRQAHSGIFHLLPLGLRVQDKIERLIDKHMQRIGASKVSLSSLSSEELWQRSGRLDKGRASELLRLEDRKGARYLLSPTHEEEITTVIANAVHSYKELPLRLYQISRKYRDELRPRQGLLRGREFLMKDLYTFDVTEDAARKTYEEVRKAYVAFLEELRLPFLVAQADSGNMGGTLSHEYHFSSSQGEDTIIKCDNCDYSINEELYVGRWTYKRGDEIKEAANSIVEHYISKDRTTLCSVYHLAEHGEQNIHAIKAIFPDIDPSVRGEQAQVEWNGNNQIYYLDPRVPFLAQLPPGISSAEEAEERIRTGQINDEVILLTKARDGDECPSCGNHSIKLRQAVEIGHTFHLGQRYSVPLEAQVLDANNRTIPIEMGCHGIGVSRLIGSVAALLKDEKGLQWPLAIAPFAAVVVPAGGVTGMDDDVSILYDRIVGQGHDVAIDDRERPVGWKLNDADLIGYPFIVVMGKKWKKAGVLELQCRRLGINWEAKDVDELLQKMREFQQGL